MRISFVILVVLSVFIMFLPDKAYACWWKGIPYDSPDTVGPPGPPPPPPPSSPPGPPPPNGGDPVLLANGDFVYQYQDLVIPSKGININIMHVYRSQSRANGRFGFGWEMTYNKSVVPVSNGDVMYLDGEGRILRFSYIDGTNYLSPPGIFDNLVQNTNGTYTLTEKHGTKYNFNATGTISSIVDRNNNTFAFTYDPAGKLPITGIPFYTNDPLTPRVIAYQYKLTKITDSAGRDITFSYNLDGRLVKIKDFINREIVYGYDSKGHLTSITDPLGKSIVYTYDSDRNLYTITDRRNYTNLANNYNQSDQVISQIYGNDTFYFSYETSVSNVPLTKFTDETLSLWKCSFDENGMPTRLEDPSGHILERYYVQLALLESVAYPDMRRINYVYDERANLTGISKTPAPDTGGTNQDTVFTYSNDYNFITSITYPDETNNAFEYDANGNLTKVIDRNNGVTVYTDNFPNFSVTDPAGRTTSFVFNTKGYITSKTTPDGETTVYTYDPVGNCLSVKGPDNRTTTYNYDLLDRLVKMTDPDNNITTYEYDANNNLTKIVYPDTSSVTFVYDQLNRLVDPNQAKDLPSADFNPTTAIAHEFMEVAFKPLPYRFIHSIRPQFGHSFSLLEWW